MNSEKSTTESFLRCLQDRTQEKCFFKGSLGNIFRGYYDEGMIRQYVNDFAPIRGTLQCDSVMNVSIYNSYGNYECTYTKNETN